LKGEQIVGAGKGQYKGIDGLKKEGRALGRRGTPGGSIFQRSSKGEDETL